MARQDTDVEEMMRLIGLVYLLFGRLRANNNKAREGLKLAPLETLTLGAVVRMDGPVTVAQITL